MTMARSELGIGFCTYRRFRKLTASIAPNSGAGPVPKEILEPVK